MKKKKHKIKGRRSDKSESAGATKKKNHYVKNDELYAAMIEWKARVNEAEQSGEPIPPVTDYIGSCFLKIAQGLAKKPIFMNPTAQACIEDAISDGVENCLMYCKNFDPNESKNPFSYFTQIIYFAFLRRIQKERKQTIIKYKYLQSQDKNGEFSEIIRAMGVLPESEETDKPKKKKKSAIEKQPKNVIDLENLE